MDDEVTQRLMAEVRQQSEILSTLKSELSSYGDLERMSLIGAVQFLVRHKKILDEIKHSLKRVSKTPEGVRLALEKIEKLIDLIDD